MSSEATGTVLTSGLNFSFIMTLNRSMAANANAIISHPKGIIEGVDQQHTGRIERVDVSMLKTLLAEGIIPVIPPLGFDGEGNTFRLNSDAIALAVSEALGAIKLIFISTTDGLKIEGKLVRQILSSDLEKALKDNAGIEAGQASKARHAAKACAKGVPRVHIINGRVTEGLLAEVFSNEGIGTLIYANEYQQIRTATKKDAPNILKLTREAMEGDELVRRTGEVIDEHISDYYIYEIDTNPVACVALREFPSESTAELMHLYVSPSHANQRIGQKLIEFAIDRATEQKMKRLFTLTTQAFTYFKSKAGFDEGALKDLPPARRAEYERNGRNSKILIKHLTI